MKSNSIQFRKIKTNNLKCIDVDILKNKINCIIGPSGSGKSSLAFDTIYAICEHEYKKILGDEDIYNYVVSDYSNLLVAISLKQTNYNINKRSTIATYYGLDNFFKYLFSSQKNIPPEMFSFNKFSSSCKKCNGLGFILSADMSKIIDYDSTLENIPFLPWRNSFKDYYRQLLLQVSWDKSIPFNTPFREINDSMKNFLIFSSTIKKFKISFKQGSRKRIKTDHYHGIKIFIDNEINDNNMDIYQYTTEIVCPLCNGTRFDSKIIKYKVFNKSIGDLYLMEFDELLTWLMIHKKSNIHINNIDSVIDFVKNIIEMKLGYLFLNRSIPSLSGGEFQRLRLSQMLHTKFENILFIMDEPLSSLHAQEKDSVIKKIDKMKKNNTVLIVEHNTDILPICDNIITLGMSGGEKGGYLFSAQDYLFSEQKKYCIKTKSGCDNFIINSNDTINNLKDISIVFPKNTCIGIGGISGSGKTTFICEILPKYIPYYKYISQKPIRGNTYSTIASYIGILDKIREFFSKATKIDASWFSYYSNTKGACKSCNGIGEIIVNDYDKKYSYICPECSGEKYTEKVRSIKCFDYNIIDVLNMEIESAIEFFKDKKNASILNKLEIASNIGLGYLKIGQKTSTLSGGEAQRIKLIKYLDIKKKNMVFAMDEPFQGMNNAEIYTIMKYFYDYIIDDNTILIAEHNLLALGLCSYIIEFGPASGKNGGKIIFNGNITKIKESKSSILKYYL